MLLLINPLLINEFMVLATCIFEIFHLLGKSYALVNTYFKCLNLINTLPLHITQITMNLGATF